MKKILQALDKPAPKKAEGAGDMKRLLQIMEGNNRLTQAENIIMQESPRPVTQPMLNKSKDAKPSMIGKYFRKVETELAESQQRKEGRAEQLAERVISKIVKEETKEQYTYRDIAEMARNGFSDDEIAKHLGFNLKEGLKDPKDNPCWKGYKPVGTKKKGGRTVPNCVPK